MNLDSTIVIHSCCFPFSWRNGLCRPVSFLLYLAKTVPSVACICCSDVLLLTWGKRVHLLSAACLIFLLSALRIKKTRVMPRPASFSIFVHRALNRSLPYCTTTSHMLSYEHRSPALAQMSLHDFLPWRRSRSCGLLLCFLLLRCIVGCGILSVRYCVLTMARCPSVS